MCAAYTLNTTNKQLTEALEGFDGLFPEVVQGRFTVHQMAPAIIGAGMMEMNFSLIPSWSKERKPKFATHNARLFSEEGEPIFKKPTWRGPFKNNHCIIPISKFIEPIYTGEFAGNMVYFFGDEILLAAGIADSWTDKATGEIIDSFTILTDDPVPFVKETGHDRTPVFISGKAAREWLLMDDEPEKMIKFLQSNRFEPKKWQVEIERPMKDGWQKRIPK